MSRISAGGDDTNGMFDFMIPDPPAAEGLRGVALTVRNAFTLSEGDYKLLRAAMGDAAAAEHVKCCIATQMGSLDAELRGLIGLHEDDNRDEAGGRFWVHYDFYLRERGAISPYKEESWDEVCSTLADLIPEHEVDFDASWRVTRDRVVLSVDVPIRLNSSEISGFSEIRGVRLVEPDPKDPENELYHVILDHLGAETAISVRGTFFGSFDHEVLMNAFERGRSIARLAVDFKEAEDDGRDSSDS